MQSVSPRPLSPDGSRPPFSLGLSRYDPSVEQASTFGWERFTGLNGQPIGMKTFGASAPLKELQKKFGFTPERAVAAKEQLARA